MEGGIGHMAEHIDDLAGWWIKVETALNSIAENVEMIQGNKVAKLRLKQMQTSWGQLKGKYLRYTQEVSNGLDA